MSILTARVSPTVEIAYECFGDPAATPLVLVMGLATQMMAWADELCGALVAEGFHVVRFDNRDVGLSTHMTSAPPPNFSAAMAGDLSSASYTLSDMAADVVGLLDAIGIASAHIVGASMGGFIAQTIAIEHPARVRSLTSIMSSTGARDVGQIAPAGMAVFDPTPVTSKEGAIARAITAAKIAGSTAYPLDEAAITARAALSYERAYDPMGVMRQGLAVVASGDRTSRLRTLGVPTVVLHGDADVICEVSGGHATAAAIPGAKLVIYPGMGHDLPRALWPQFVAEISGVARRAEAERSTQG